MLSAVTAFSLFGFTACGNTSPEKLMSPSWGIYEKLTYIYEHTENGETTAIGEYTAEITYVEYYENAPPVKIGDIEIPLKSYREGYLLHTKLSYGGAEAVVTRETDAFFYRNANGGALYPAASLVVTDDGNLPAESSLIVYDGDRKVSFTREQDGRIINHDYKFNKKDGLVFDNAAIYYALRALPLGDAPQISFETCFHVPGADDMEIAAMTAASAADYTVSDERLLAAIGKFEVPCYTVVINRDSNAKGTGYYAYYAKDAVNKDGVSIGKLPVRIVEGNTKYTLVSVSVTR
jgi:hypothetical protein